MLSEQIAPEQFGADFVSLSNLEQIPFSLSDSEQIPFHTEQFGVSILVTEQIGAVFWRTLIYHFLKKRFHYNSIYKETKFLIAFDDKIFNQLSINPSHSLSHLIVPSIAASCCVSICVVVSSLSRVVALPCPFVTNYIKKSAFPILLTHLSLHLILSSPRCLVSSRCLVLLRPFVIDK